MIANLNKYIDHTILKAFAGEKEIETLCADARNYDFASVCVNPCFVPLAKKLLAGSGVKVCTVIGFPLGANATEGKAFETRHAYDEGCDEFDMVIAVGALKDRRCDYVKSDIAAVVKAARGKVVKVIIETAFLTDEEKTLACKLAGEAGAAFVKTCTGFNEGVATVHDIGLMKGAVPAGVRVKASSGIRSYEAAAELIAAGADRLGTSAGAKIIADAPKK